MIKRAIVTVGLVGALGCAVSAPAQAVTAGQAAKVGVAHSQAEEEVQTGIFQGTIVEFKDDYLVLETAEGTVRISLLSGPDYCGKLRMGVSATAEVFEQNGEWAAQKVVTE